MRAHAFFGAVDWQLLYQCLLAKTKGTQGQTEDGVVGVLAPQECMSETWGKPAKQRVPNIPNQKGTII